jgi:hypothetical protein
VLCLIVVPLPPDKILFAVQLNNNNNSEDTLWPESASALYRPSDNILSLLYVSHRKQFGRRVWICRRIFLYVQRRLQFKTMLPEVLDHLCGLVVRVLGYRSGGPGSIPGTTREKKVVGLERGALSLVSTTEELLDRKVAAPCRKPRTRT